MEKDKILHVEDIVKKIIADVLCVKKNAIKGNSLLKKDLGSEITTYIKERKTDAAISR